MLSERDKIDATIKWFRSQPEGTKFVYNDFINHIMMTYKGTSYPEANRIFTKILHAVA